MAEQLQPDDATSLVRRPRTYSLVSLAGGVILGLIIGALLGAFVPPLLYPPSHPGTVSQVQVLPSYRLDSDADGLLQVDFCQVSLSPAPSPWTCSFLLILNTSGTNVAGGTLSDVQVEGGPGLIGTQPALGIIVHPNKPVWVNTTVSIPSETSEVVPVEFNLEFGVSI